MATLVSGAPLTGISVPRITPVFTAQGQRVDREDPANAASKAFIQQQIAALPQTYEAQKAGAAARVGQQLAGYGGYAVDAAGNVTHDASQVGSGQRERTAVSGERSAANARGTLYSSFTDTGVSNALNRLSETARGVTTQYAAELSGYLNDASSKAANLYGQWAGAIDRDTQFMLENPPAAVAPAVTPPVTAAPAAPAATTAAAAPLFGMTTSATKAGLGTNIGRYYGGLEDWLGKHYKGTALKNVVARTRSDPSFAASVYARIQGGR